MEELIFEAISSLFSLTLQINFLYPIKALFRNSLIASLCAAAGIMVSSSNVLAQSVDAIVPFDVTIPNTCVFGTPNNGTFAQSVNAVAVEAGGGITGLAFGTAGSVTLDCATGGSVTVALPTELLTPGSFNPGTLQSVVSLGGSGTDATMNFSGTQFWPFPTAALNIPAGQQNLLVAAYAGDGVTGNLPVGDYSYTVTLTATPN